MSVSSQLIFTASSQKAFNSYGDDGEGEDAIMGVEDPNNYRNNMRNVVKVPANSEIALVNAEFNRSISFLLNEDMLFYWYYGEQLNGTVPLSSDKTGTIPYPIFMDTSGYDSNELRALDTSALFRIIQKSINKGVTHPDWINSAVVQSDTTGQKLQVILSFAGLVTTPFGVTKIPADGTSTGAILSWFLPAYQNLATLDTDLYYEATTTTTEGDTISRVMATSSFSEAATGYPDGQWDDDCRVICRTAPISTMKGEWTGDFSNAPDGFSLELVRPITHDMWEDDYETLLDYKNLDGDATTFWKFGDYQVMLWDAEDGKPKQIRCYQTMRNYDATENTTWTETREIIYWGNTGGGRPAAAITNADLFAQGKQYNYFKWIVEGNCVAFIIGDKGDFTGVNQLIFSSRTTDDAVGVLPTQKPIPTNAETEALYPVVDLPAKGASIVTIKFESGSNVSTNRGDIINGVASYNYPMDATDQSNTKLFLGEDDFYYEEDDAGVISAIFNPGSSMWGSAWLGETKPAEAPFENYAQVMREGILTLGCRYYTYNGYDGLAARFPTRYTGLDSPILEAPGLSNGIINVATDGYDADNFDFNNNGEYCTLPDLPPSASLTLGMAYKNLIQGIDGIMKTAAGTINVLARKSWTVEGTNALGEDPNPLLVEVPSLNQQSYNMCRQCPSKFIYVCPRHDNSGGQFGRLFYEPGEKTYVSLNNPSELNITDMEVRFTDKNGVTTQELIGSSAVTFHIRREHRHPGQRLD